MCQRGVFWVSVATGYVVANIARRLGGIGPGPRGWTFAICGKHHGDTGSVPFAEGRDAATAGPRSRARDAAPCG